MNYEREQHLFELGQLDHSALMPPRKGCVGETVYAAGWTTLMCMRSDFSAPPNELLGDILQMCEPLTQRHATVAASFITWLGTNCGLSFLMECRRYAKGEPECAYQLGTSKAWLGQWAWDNRRRIGVNGGYRTIEHILSTPECFGTGAHGITVLMHSPDLTAEDYETIEHLVAWLPTERGQKFLAVCDLEIEERRNELNLFNRGPKPSNGWARPGWSA